jgi:hypothetical protein
MGGPVLWTGLPWLFFFFELDHHDFDGVGAAVDVGVGRVGWVGGKPVGFAYFPVMDFDGSGGGHELHGAAAEGDDDAGMVVAVHGEGLIGQDDGAPDLDVFVVELGEALGGGLLGVYDSGGGHEEDGLRGDEDVEGWA